jgi:hypothetical protein
MEKGWLTIAGDIVLAITGAACWALVVLAWVLLVVSWCALVLVLSGRLPWFVRKYV